MQEVQRAPAINCGSAQHLCTQPDPTQLAAVHTSLLPCIKKCNTMQMQRFRAVPDSSSDLSVQACDRRAAVARSKTDELSKKKSTNHYVEHVFVLVHLSHDKARGTPNIGAPFPQHPVLLHSEGVHAIIMVKAIGVYHRPGQWSCTCDTRALMIKHTVHMLNLGLLAAPNQVVTLHKAICMQS